MGVCGLFLILIWLGGYHHSPVGGPHRPAIETVAPSTEGVAGDEMPDIAVAELPVDEDERPLPPPEAPAKNALLDRPILPTLLWLAWPNVIAMSSTE